MIFTLEYFKNNFTAEYHKASVRADSKTGVLVQWEHPKIRVEYGWGQEHQKPAISPNWCKIGPRLLRRTNRKLHMRFRLVPKSMTLNDRNVTLAEIESFYGAHDKNFNKHRPMLLAAKCRLMIYADIRGGSSGGASIV